MKFSAALFFASVASASVLGQRAECLSGQDICDVFDYNAPQCCEGTYCRNMGGGDDFTKGSYIKLSKVVKKQEQCHAKDVRCDYFFQDCCAPTFAFPTASADPRLSSATKLVSHFSVSAKRCLALYHLWVLHNLLPTGHLGPCNPSGDNECCNPHETYCAVTPSKDGEIHGTCTSSIF
ncbi:hypothetical protein VHEMI01687 [[Torrubiella] hemipterigena]|uniref:Uncharacterized protein n=1 Tax=[Torrubiella] hemipterigena TaxID=1531966 RepID=A0A0A1STR4_9HYPO|nr:hypothetical protein VHEMI01687 [[Torrubiella] hemipterigena]